MYVHSDGLCGPCRRELETAAEVIRRLADLWRHENDFMRRRLEILTGAQIYYFSGAGTLDLWSTRVSRDLLKAWMASPQAKATRSHEIPRSIAARELLTTPPRRADDLGQLWRQRYGVFSLATRQENIARKWSGDRPFQSPADANRSAGIELVVATRDELRAARRGERKTIRDLLKRPTSYWEPPLLDK